MGRTTTATNDRLRTTTLAVVAAALTALGLVASPVSAVANVPPTVELTSPVEASWQGGTLVVSGIMDDADTEEDLWAVEVEINPLGAAPVAFQRIENLASTTFSMTFDMSGLPDGRYGVRATVYDHDETTGTDARTFQLDTTQPNAQIASPNHHAVVSGDLDIEITAYDPAVVAPASGIVHVQVSIEGFGYQAVTALPTSKADTWIGTVDTTQLDDGDAWLGAIITDAAGNQRFVYDRKVTIDNGPGEVAPQVTITSPTDGASVAGTVVVSGHVIDEQGDLPTDAAATLSLDDVVVDSQLLFGDGALPANSSGNWGHRSRVNPSARGPAA